MPLDPDCLVRLKLRQAPFDDVPSEDFLYSDPLLESLIETAARALGSAGAIVILAGASGSGRSIQLMRLLGTLEGRYELIAFRGRPNIPFDAVDVTIRAHLRAAGFDDPKRTVAELLAERAKARARLVLAIDDAHCLGGESLLQLLRMRSEVLEVAEQGLRLVLVGETSLSRARLPLPDPLDDNQVVRLHLRPFNLEQAGAYLRHRLRVAGIEDPDTFLTSGDIAVLQTSSKGLPAALNAQATAWLMRRCRSAGGFKQAIVGKLGGSATPAGARVGSVPISREAPSAPPVAEPEFEPPEGILDLDQEMEPDTYQPSGRPPADPQLSDFLVGEVERAEMGDFEQILRRVREHQQGQGASDVPEPKAASREDLRASAPRASKLPYWNRPWFIPVLLVVVLLATLTPVAIGLLNQSAPPQPPMERETSEPVQPPADDTREEPAAAAPAPVAAPPQAPSSDVPPAQAAPQAQDAALEAQGEAAQPEPAKQAEPPEQTEPAKNAVMPDLQEDLDWLKRQDEGRFTVQLVAARDLATSRAFAVSHGLEGIHFIQTRSYVIGLFGSFPSREQAARVLPDLPQAVRENGPWIRTIGSIRETLP